jgi:NAD(P)-dependent dehydrogenase (short-subunit alcohol dehydrogenase family)
MSMYGLLEGKVALVTGGASGIGRATARMLARDGARVGLCDRQVELGLETVSLIEEAGGDALFVEADVSRAGDMQACVQAVVERYGALHCAVNNAAAGAGFQLLEDLPEAGWDRVMDVNLKGVWHGLRFQVPAILASGGGAIVNVASVSGMRGEATQAAYSASKGGLIALTKSAAAELAQRGVRVNAVCPGGIRTPAIATYFERVPEAERASIATHAMRRLGEPDEIADAIAYLCSERASFVTGHAMVVDGGVLVNPHTM